MCGIVGFWDSRASGQHLNSVRLMADRIKHRGPDSAGDWISPRDGLAIAHRRLAILDLSPAGRQPMVSADGRWVIAFNGEIYNHRDLRHLLHSQGFHPDWRGHSDTETLVEAIAAWGFAETLHRLNGMFAIAAWDVSKRELLLARDRMGEKPLYYGRSGQTFLFSSELKALSAYPAWSGRINRDVLALYLRHNYVPDPYCIYEGMRKLPPGHYLTTSNRGQDVSEPTAFWDLGQVASIGLSSRHSFELAGAADELETLLSDAVRIRMAADVPLGAFLSGGYDSATIVALMVAQSNQPVHTFSIGFTDSQFDEAPHARAVANHLGTQHTELYVTAQDALDVVPRLPQFWDEPFADSSQIPTVLVSRMARQHVKVALSGDGGDELFCGYTRYRLADRMWAHMSRFPASMRNVAGRALSSLPSSAINTMLQHLASPGLASAGDRLGKLGGLLRQDDQAALYRALVSNIQQPSDILVEGVEPKTLLQEASAAPLMSFQDWMMFVDTLTYLPGDILTKVDRASMAVSLEARVPMLDHRVVEFAWGLPVEAKVQGAVSKLLLKEVLHRHVPKALMERPKKGFSVPLADWLRGPLRDWADELLHPERLRAEGYFDAQSVSRLWQEHRSGKRRWHGALWCILMFQAWLDQENRVGQPK